MHKAAVDLFDLNSIQYLAMADRYSGYPWVQRLHSVTTEAVCKVLLAWFCDFGFPREIKLAGGRQFQGPFAQFCLRFHIHHEVSSPYNLQSNGLAEAAVKQ